MLAVHLEAGKVEVRDEPMPVRSPGFSLIRLIAAGICNTDLELQRGYYGFTGRPGHEFVGEVVESDSAELIGKRVVGEINLGCHQPSCQWCASGWDRHCPNRTVLGIVNHPGAFAEYLTLPDRNLRVVPAQVSTEHAVFCEPLAAARRILDQLTPQAGQTVAVLGDGKLGLLIAQTLAASGCAVTQIGRHAEKLRISAARGVRTTLAPPQGEWFDLVVDATGSAQGLKSAVALTKPLGTLVLKSTVHDAAEFSTTPIAVNEITVVGSRCGRFEPALDLLAAGSVDVASLLSDSFPLADATRAFERAGEPGVLKVLLRNG